MGVGLGIFSGSQVPNWYRSEKSGFGYLIEYIFIYVFGTGLDRVLPEIRTTT